MTGVCCFGISEEGGEITAAAGGGYPFGNCAVGGVAVIENCCRPAGEDC